MDPIPIILVSCFLASFLVFIVPRSFKYALTAIIVFAISLVTGIISIQVIHRGFPYTGHFAFGFFYDPVLTIDSLTAFFLLAIDFTMITGIIYAKGYLSEPHQKQESMLMSLHFFSYVWLHISMVMLVMFRNGLAFLITWELMTVSSFILVIFDARQRSILKAGIYYLMQMHVGLILVMTGFLIAAKDSGTFGFNGLAGYFAGHPNLPLFLLFFAGFGIKAGFVPFHTWLPEAHPAAPSHVSGVMSGVMIKMGIYGILRVIEAMQADWVATGSIVLIISVLTGLYGVMFAIMQHDLKRLLAFHSIENIGIIGIGIAAGMLGKGYDIPLLTILGFGGALLHVLNHSLFKSMLFYSAGNVYTYTHNRNIENMGGLIKVMPKTAFMFLFASVAICGLPPLNGFISEFLIYAGLFSGLHIASPFSVILILGAIAGLAMIGGLALFCFTKAFGIAFLGEARKPRPEEIREDSPALIFPGLLIGILILIIGVFPLLFAKPLLHIAEIHFIGYNTVADTHLLFSSLQYISIIALIFIITGGLLWVIRKQVMRNRSIQYGPTWGCGYTAITPVHQYTSTSFSDDFSRLAKPIIPIERHMKPIAEVELFPAERGFERHSTDGIKNKLIDAPSQFMVGLIKRMAVLQTGKMQHYVLYALVFIIVVIIFSFLNIF